MKNMILLGFALAFSPASGFCGDQQIAFERDQHQREKLKRLIKNSRFPSVSAL